MRLRITTMSAFSREALETISSWSEVLAAVFATLAALSGIAYLLSTRPLRKIEVRENAILQRETADAQAEAAKAQLALRSYIDAVARRALPRRVDHVKFLDCLKGKPKASVEILYKPEDKEAWQFARSLNGLLGSEGAGWKVSKMKPIPANGTWDGAVPDDAPADIRYGGAWATGLILRANEVREKETAIGALTDALRASAEIGFETVQDRSLPDGHIIIVVGEK